MAETEVVDVEAGITLSSESYILALWCVRLPRARRDGDWMACVWRDDPAHDWTMRCRFRYYNDAKTGVDSADQKNWYADKIPADTPEDAILDRIDFSVLGMLVFGCTDAERLLVRGDTRALEAAVRTAHAEGRAQWFHMEPFQES